MKLFTYSLNDVGTQADCMAPAERHVGTKTELTQIYRFVPEAGRALVIVLVVLLGGAGC